MSIEELKAENARLKAENDRLREIGQRYLGLIDYKDEDIGRIISAGNDLAYAIRSKIGIGFALEEWDNVANTEEGHP